MLIHNRYRVLSRHGFLVALACCVGGFTQNGCREPEQTSSYSVAKPPPPSQAVNSTPPREARMLGAIIPQGEKTWFFKVTGSPEVLDKQTETFRQFIESVRFSDGEQPAPQWELPAQWQRDAGSGMRFATLRFGPTEAPLELSVIPLPTRGQDVDAYVLQNINLWRRQLGLTPLAEPQLAEQTVPLQLEGATATMVNYVGQLASHGMAPGPGARQMATPTPGHPPIGQPSPLEYEKPDGWIEGQVGGMRKGAFTVTDCDQQAEITVIDLSGSAGDLLANVNRWRGQIQLEPMTQTQLDETTEKITIDQSTGDYVELIGPEDADPREAILGAILTDSNRTWFFKLKGPAELAEREKEHFRSFVQSANFDSANGVGDGK